MFPGTVGRRLGCGAAGVKGILNPNTGILNPKGRPSAARRKSRSSMGASRVCSAVSHLPALH